MANVYSVGDIHGHNKALIDCLNKVNFDFENDTLISLGDIVDRGPDSYGCIETLLKIKNLIKIRGNHDDCWINHLNDPITNPLWRQGALETKKSYDDNGKDILIHKDFFVTQRPYYILEKDNKKYCFVHGGFNRHFLIETQLDYTLWWDRDLFMQALSYDSMLDKEYKFRMKDNFDLVFIGHTPTQHWINGALPLKAANIWNLDTGCGKSPDARLTIMNIETEEYYQSEKIGDLYGS